MAADPSADEDLTQHPAYALGAQHAFSGILPNPFDRPDATDLPGVTAAAGGVGALPQPRQTGAAVAAATRRPTTPTAPVASPRIYPSPAAANTSATPPAASEAFIDQATRVGPTDTKGHPITAAVSREDWAKRSGGPSDPFSNGFFKTGDERAKIEQDRLAGSGGGAVAALPQRSAPVGGTTAVAATPPSGRFIPATNSVPRLAVRSRSTGDSDFNVDGSSGVSDPEEPQGSSNPRDYAGQPGWRTPVHSISPQDRSNIVRSAFAGDFARPGADRNAVLAANTPAARANLFQPRTRNQSAVRPTSVPRSFFAAR